MNASIARQLKPEWIELASKYCADTSLINSIFDTIVKHYSEAHRHYHTLQHLQDVFNDLAKPLTELSDSEKNGIRFSVWFHDIIYQAGHKDNEKLSADLAVDALNQLCVPEDTIHFVRHAILCTQKHFDPSQGYATQLFLDADMAILGKPEDNYIEYKNKVRDEFGHIPAPLYKRGRRKFIESVLSKDTIYYTNYFRDLFNEQARANTTAENA